MPKKTFIKKAKRIIRRKFKTPSLIGFIKGGSLGFPFPSMLKVRLRTQISLDASASVGPGAPISRDTYFKLNSPLDVGPAVNYPLGTLSAFSANVPAGLAYLLSSNSIVGASGGPYQKFFVKSSSIRINISTFGVANDPVKLTVVPISQVATANTTASQTIAEQPNAKTILLPPVMNGFKVLKHRISVAKLGGLTSLGTSNDTYVGGQQTIGQPLIDPAELYVWQIRTSNANVSTTLYSLAMAVEVIHDIIFFDRNYANSLVPA